MGDKPSLFRSRYAAARFICRKERKVYHPTTGVLIDHVPELVAEFAQHLGEFDYQDDTGATRRGADIRGHFFDLDAFAEEKNLTDDEKEQVRAALLLHCRRSPADIWVHESPKANAPWPTYDSTHHNKIPVLAEELGLLDEAIAYEGQNKNRESVISALEERKQTAQVAEELTAA